MLHVMRNIFVPCISTTFTEADINPSLETQLCPWKLNTNNDMMIIKKAEKYILHKTRCTV